MRKKLYLANPYGFSKQTKTLLYEFIEIFNDLNVEVFEPFERAKPLMQKKVSGHIMLQEVISMI